MLRLMTYHMNNVSAILIVILAKSDGLEKRLLWIIQGGKNLAVTAHALEA